MVKEAEDIALKEYKFSPEKILVNGTEVTDYTSAELDKIFLVNRKGILQAEKPSWIPELDVSDLRRNDFLPACVNDFSDGSYFVLNKSDAGKDSQGNKTYRTDIYKMPLDILTATIDYYLKKEREQLKQSGSSAKVSLPRSRKSMTTERFDEIVSLLPLCGCYRNEQDFTKKDRSRKRTQINRVFAEQYIPLLDEINGKKIDLNYSKQDLINSYSKGEETSYGDSGTSSDIYEKHGVRIKKQNGTAFTKDELSSLDSTVSKVWKFYGGGTGLKNLAESYNLKISYADDCNQHARKAIGLFTPFYNAIGISFFKGKGKEERANYTNPDNTLAHETAHWLDSQKGNELHCFFASDKKGTLENKIASAYKNELKIRQKQLKTKSRRDESVEYAPLGDYWFRTCECLARAMEQRYALGLGISMGKEQGYLPDEIYKKKILPLADELLDENKKYFHLAEYSKETERKQEDFKTKFERGDFDKFFSDYLDAAKGAEPQEAVLRFKSETEPLWSKLFADGEPEEIQSLRKKWQSQIQEAKNEVPKHLEDWRKQAENAALEKLKALDKHLKKNDSGTYPRTAAEETDLNERTFKKEVIGSLLYAYFSKGHTLDSSTIHTLDWSNVQIRTVPATQELTNAQISIVENELRKRGVSLETPEQNNKSKQADKKEKMQENVSENINSEFDSRPEVTEAELHGMIAVGGNNDTLKEYLNKSPTYKDLSAPDAEIILKWAHNFNGTRENQFNVYILKDKTSLVASRPFSTWRKINSNDLMDIARNNVEEALATQKRTNKISKEELKEIHKLFPRSGVISDAYRKAFPPPPEPTLFDFAEEEKKQATAGKDSHDQIEIRFAEKAGWKNENGEEVYVFLEKEKFDKGYKGLKVGLAKNFDEKNNTYNNSDHSYHGIAVVRDDGTVREQDSLPLLHAVAHPDDENIRLLSGGERREFDVIMRNINPEYKKAYEDKLEQERRDRESNAGKNAANYVLDRLKSAGIEVVTDKDEFERILELKQNLQMMSLASTKPETIESLFISKNEENLNSEIDKLAEKDVSLKDDFITISEKTPFIFKEFGLGDFPVNMYKQKLARAFFLEEQKFGERITHGHKGEFTSKTVKDVLKNLGNPRYIFNSKQNLSNPENFYLIGVYDELDEQKNPMVLSLHFNKNRKEIEANWITSIYGKRKNILVNDWTQKGYLVYMNDLEMEKAPAEVVTLQMRVSKSASAYIDNVKKKSDFVNDFDIAFNKNQENVYGFAYNGKIYLNPDFLTSNVAVHEYTHLWDEYTRRTNPELWQKGMDILKDTKLFAEVKSDPNYADIAADDNLVLSEVHARICGKLAQKYLEKIAKEDGEIKRISASGWNKEVAEYVEKELFPGREIFHHKNESGLYPKTAEEAAEKNEEEFKDDILNALGKLHSSYDHWLSWDSVGVHVGAEPVSNIATDMRISILENELKERGILKEKEKNMEKESTESSGKGELLSVSGSEGWLADEETVKSLESKIAGTIKDGKEKLAQEFTDKVSTYTRFWDADARMTDNARWRNGMNIMKKIVPVEGGIDENIGKLTEGHASLCAKIMNSFRERLAEEGKAWGDLDIDKDVYKYINENFKGTRTLSDGRKLETTGFGVFGPVEINAVCSWFSSPIKDIIKGREISLEQNTFTQEKAEEKEINNLSAAGELEALAQQNDLKDKQNAAADISIQIRKDGKHFLNELYKEIEQNPIVFPFLTDGEIDTDSKDKNFELAMAKTLAHVTKNAENPQKMKENIGKYLSLEIKEKTKIKESLEKTLLQMKSKKIERKQKKSMALERG